MKNIKEEELNRKEKDNTTLIARRFKGIYRICGKFGYKPLQSRSKGSRNYANLNNRDNNDRFKEMRFLCG